MQIRTLKIEFNNNQILRRVHTISSALMSRGGERIETPFFNFSYSDRKTQEDSSIA